ncbi:hypothetical protein ASD12_26080 [Mesorhizobium sp. Root102]|nr:hypothetical protein ASD12_26080 [Mesorhizobium sp. Root102]
MADKEQFGLAAVDTVPLMEKVYLELVRAQVSGHLQGTGTSDMPVRSAFMRLQALQVLSPMPTVASRCH